MGGQGTLALAGGEGQDDDGWAEAVAQIVLNDEHRALSSLLRADDGIQIGKIYVTAFHVISRSDGDSQRAAAAADGEGENTLSAVSICRRGSMCFDRLCAPVL